ncbi:hypothetical protein [Fodinicola feengrottensis]|uniref:Uncharacterized protein n=1 Tax=Fodinicola feengrottensis TaxID=435914 RepID=A0ABN2IC00_9ACTN|nr:hypothetical protein [Fodinicola feengrottensis]
MSTILRRSLHLAILTASAAAVIAAGSPASASALAAGAHVPATIAAPAACSIPANANDGVLKTLKTVGDSRHVTAKVRLAMFETAWVESHANNLGCGTGDSVGVFQQSPSNGWGTKAQCMNVTHAAGKFLDQAIPNSANHPSWTAGHVAQSVQRSAYPDRYDAAQTKANALIARSRTL